jgi:hypothetical protein
MKVKTNLKAGNLISNANQDAKQIFRTTGNFLNQQNNQVKKLASDLSAKVGGLWNSIAL